MKTKEKIVLLLIIYLIETLNRFSLSEEQKESIKTIKNLTKDCIE